MSVTRILTALGIASISASMLVGCRAEEQGRVMMYQPGVYLGKKDVQLSSDQVRILRQRSSFQRNSVYRNAGG
jgi:hypothetical protein